MKKKGKFLAWLADPAIVLSLALGVPQDILPGISEAFFIEVSAAEIVQSGTCGENVTWELDSDGVLPISGTGAMTDYNSNVTPWYHYVSKDTKKYRCKDVKKIIIKDGVTTIGGYDFYGFSNLISVEIPDSIEAIALTRF